MPTNELEMFLAAWDREAASTVKLLQALPATQYDFRPDATGRSLGELAWHLAEGDVHQLWDRSTAVQHVGCQTTQHRTSARGRRARSEI
jgi:uncharacterized damage-inducible protein DinB